MPALSAGETDAYVADLLAENPILLSEVLDQVPLPAVQPSRDGENQELKWERAQGRDRSGTRRRDLSSGVGRRGVNPRPKSAFGASSFRRSTG